MRGRRDQRPLVVLGEVGSGEELSTHHTVASLEFAEGFTSVAQNPLYTLLLLGQDTRDSTVASISVENEGSYSFGKPKMGASIRAFFQCFKGSSLLLSPLELSLFTDECH